MPWLMPTLTWSPISFIQHHLRSNFFSSIVIVIKVRTWLEIHPSFPSSLVPLITPSPPISLHRSSHRRSSSTSSLFTWTFPTPHSARFAPNPRFAFPLRSSRFTYSQLSLLTVCRAPPRPTPKAPSASSQPSKPSSPACRARHPSQRTSHPSRQYSRQPRRPATRPLQRRRTSRKRARAVLGQVRLSGSVLPEGWSCLRFRCSSCGS
jgi:hypothetical protein